MDRDIIEALARMTRELEELKIIIHLSMDPRQDPDRLLMAKDVAAFAQVSKREVLRWKECGLPFYPCGKGFRFRKSDVLSFIEKMRTQTDIGASRS